MHLNTFSIYILGNIWKIAECSEISRPTGSSRPSSSEGKKVSFQLEWILILVFFKMLQYVLLALLVVLHPTCLLFHKHISRLFPHSLSDICMVISGWKVLAVVCTLWSADFWLLKWGNLTYFPSSLISPCKIFLIFSPV